MVAVTGTIEYNVIMLLLMMMIGAGTLMIIICDCGREMKKDATDLLRIIGKIGRLLLWMALGSAAMMTSLYKRAAQIARRERELTDSKTRALWSRGASKAPDEGSLMTMLASQFLTTLTHRSPACAHRSGAFDLSSACADKASILTERSSALADRSPACAYRSGAVNRSSALADSAAILTERSGACALRSRACALRSGALTRRSAKTRSLNLQPSETSRL